jgi:hypothetical protein
MAHLALTLDAHPHSPNCAWCKGPVGSAPGPRLCLAETLAPLCSACTKKHAPALAALADLARVADKVGRIGRHTLVPPMAALLDLARAAEDYARHRTAKETNRRRRQTLPTRMAS